MFSRESFGNIYQMCTEDQVRRIWIGRSSNNKNVDSVHQSLKGLARPTPSEKAAGQKMQKTSTSEAFVKFNLELHFFAQP